MSSIPPDNTKLWLAALIFTALGVVTGYQLTPSTQEPLTPPFAFTSGKETIEATGSWSVPGSDIPNATRIFCWFPSNSCQVTVAELVPEGSRTRFQLMEKVLDITQLSDATLTASASTTDACKREVLHIDRGAQTATLSVSNGTSVSGRCAGDDVLTATLGR